MFPCYFGRSNETTLPLGLSFAPIFSFLSNLGLAALFLLRLNCLYHFLFLFCFVLSLRPFSFVLTSRRFILYRSLARVLQRIEALENRQQSSVESGLSNLSVYGLRRKPDFDKYAALALAEDLVVVAQNSKHEKATFLSAATRALRDRLEKPVEQFQAYFMDLFSWICSYFMDLFSDKDYSKVLDSIAKVDKALRVTAPSASNSASSATRSSFKNTRLICNFCGIPGHTSPFCFLSVGVQLGAGSLSASPPC